MKLKKNYEPRMVHVCKVRFKIFLAEREFRKICIQSDWFKIFCRIPLRLLIPVPFTSINQIGISRSRLSEKLSLSTVIKEVLCVPFGQRRA